MIGSLVHLFRNLRAGFVLAREGALALIDPNVLPPAARMALRLARLIERRQAGDGAARLSAALTRLGPSYVKFGQFLATRPDIVGVAAARDLEHLQDRMPPFPRKDAVRMVEIALGRPIGELFLEFSEPIAAASIAQVHKAVIRTPEGPQTVAVKVVRPGVREGFARDLQAMRAAARLVERLVPDAKRLKPVEVVEALARSVAVEMDLRLEAAAVSELGENTRDDPDFRVPKPEWDLTARDVLTITWIDGIRLNDVAGIEAAGFDRVALARTVIQSFLRHAIRDGFFHADMHPGNLFVDPQGRLVAVDFGIMGRLGMKERRFLAEILLGFIRRDYLRVARVHFEAGYVPPHHSVEDFAQALRAIGEPIHDRRADEISMAKLLSLLFEITALFDMATRIELVMLQKTMVVVEGVARNLDPRLDMWTTSEPVVREWIERHLGPVGRIEEAGSALSTLGGLAADLPDMALRARRVLNQLEDVTAKGVPLHKDSVSAIGRAEARGNRWSAAALWIIALSLMILAIRGF
ncbi:2-polyprenylphenol 6-hydroxylase [Microvirga thermotolerans]|uniref:2-polyprenylphenol 6-hydroxylase n=1 Tax=Microvirga thermotolerans TaxID=2651334 RepID=A0A5P9K2P6_9HYPH|nr:2-polyprenylphenol 6-hydroxylase [Microvirga thermotolerans]QFU17960.1 2-polyprenylphenol 6-hydroxylase [Microvirga thermotolerans]